MLNTQQDDSQPMITGSIYSSEIAQRQWGDRHEDLNNDHMRRLVFQNFNEITSFATVHAENQANHIRLQGHLTGMSETNVNWKNYTFRNRWEQRLMKGYTELKFCHRSCDERSENALQRGGCSMSCTSCLHSRLLDRGSDEDLFSQWAWMTFKGTDKLNVVVFTAYQVSPKHHTGLGVAGNSIYATMAKVAIFAS